MKRRHRAAIWVAIVVTMSVVAAIVAAPRYVRHKASEWASGRGLILEAGEVRVRPGSVQLEKVRITSPFFPGQEVKLDSVGVRLDGMKIEAVEVEGGTVSLSGKTKDLERMYREWSERRSESKGGGGGGGGGSRKSVNGVNVSWIESGEDGPRASASGVSWHGGEASAKLVNVRLGNREAELSGLRLSKDGVGYEINLEKARVKLPGRKDGGPGAGGISRTGLPALPTLGSPIRVRVHEATAEVGEKRIEAEDLDMSATNESGKIGASLSAKHLEVPGKMRFLKFGAKVRVGKAEASGKAWFGSIGTSHKALTDSEIETGGAEVSGEVKATTFGLEATADIQLGMAKVHVVTQVRKDELKVQAEMGESECQEVLESVPKALVKTIMPGTKLKGKVSWGIQVAVDLPERKKPSVGIKLKNGCSIEGLPDGISAKALRRPFVRTALGYDKKEREVRTGPGSPEWVPIQLVSRFVPISLKTMEDPGFNGHRGFLIEALENALKADIQEGRFARGGSTITMQLAKNLWLGREKTLSRKLQEAVLTTYLEQELPKDQILELYMNVVEFGPGVYGIKAAAKKYFNADPMELTLSQSLLLASVLPKPNGAYFGPDGAVQQGRLALLHRIMKAMLDTQKISEDEYREGVKEVPREGVPETAVGPADKIEASPDGLDPGSWQAD